MVEREPHRGQRPTLAIVRALGPDEWPTIREVRLRSLADAPSAFTSTHQRESRFDEVAWRERARTCQWFVAEYEGAAVGIAGGVAGWSGDPTRRELVGMWVAPAHRGRGLARALLDRVAGWAREEGATVLTLGVRQGNRGARAAYTSMGLRFAGTMSEFGNPDALIELMELELD